jgi:hypothetical protein
MASIFLIGLLAVVVFGAVNSHTPPGDPESLFTRLRHTLARDHALHLTSTATRVLLRSGKARPVLECLGTTRERPFEFHAWYDDARRAQVEITMQLDASALLTYTHYSIEVHTQDVSEHTWTLRGDDSRAFMGSTLKHGASILELIHRLNEACGSTASMLSISSRREVVWRAELDLEVWERNELTWSHLMSWIVPQGIDATILTDHEPVSMTDLVHGLGACVESLAPEVARIMQRRDTAQLDLLIIGHRDDDRARHLTRLVRAWHLCPAHRDSLAHAVLTQESLDDVTWPLKERSARRFAAAQLAGAPRDIASSWRWFVRAAHPQRSAPERVAWCVETLSQARSEDARSLGLFHKECAPSVCLGDELYDMIMSVDVARDATAMRHMLEHVSLSGEAVERVCLEVLKACGQGAPGRSAMVMSWLHDFGTHVTSAWVARQRTRRRFSRTLRPDVEALMHALAHKRQRGALSPVGHPRSGKISMSPDQRGELAVWSEEPAPEETV